MSGGMEDAAEEDKVIKFKSTSPTTTALVIKDLVKREQLGIKKYGHTVDKSPDDMLQHLYEELLDACCYIKTEIERRKQ